LLYAILGVALGDIPFKYMTQPPLVIVRFYLIDKIMVEQLIKQ